MSNIFYPNDLLEGLEEIKSLNSCRKGVSTGFRDLDELMTLDKGYLSIISGLPSSGKSEFLDAILMNMAIVHGWRTLYYSPENYPLAEHLKKHTERYLGKQLHTCTKAELKTATDFNQEYFAWMYPEEDFSIDGLLTLAAEEHNRKPLDAIVIDPWNEVDHSKQGGFRDDQYISKCLTKIRRQGRDMNTHIFVVAHPTNPSKAEKEADGNYKPPTLNEISGGAVWRAKADYGWIAHRHPLENVIKILIMKIKYKSMGRIGSASFDYDFKSGRFKGINETEYLLPCDIETAF